MLRRAKLLFSLSIVLFLASCDRPSPSFKITTKFNTQDTNTVSQAPYVLPRCFNTREHQDLKILISAVGTQNINVGACSIETDENNSDFSLQWSQAKITMTQVQVAEVNVRSENVFSDKADNRSQLKNSFLAFQQQLSKLEEDESNQCLNKGDAQILGQRVANALPLRLDEILSYNYGFDADNRVIDLQAGMRLRVEQGAYQFIDPQDDSSAAYVGSGSSYLHLVQRPDQSLAFEPYLGAMNAIEADPSNQGETGRTRMISGAMGLAAVGVSRRYARLVYPSQYPTTKNTTAVEAEGELPMRVGLLLADRAQDLAKATQRYLADNSCSANESNSVMCFYFSGRSFVIPEVLVKIKGIEKYVSVGTTLRDAFNQYSVIPVSQIGNRQTGGFSPELKRWMQPGLCREQVKYQPTRILFETNSPLTTSTLSQWDMPLLKGDELNW